MSKITTLPSKYPELFPTGIVESKVGDGWFNILNSLCRSLYREVDQVNKRITYLNNLHRHEDQHIQELEIKLKEHHELVERLPNLVAFSASFGKLVVHYTNGDNSPIEHYIRFAEEMSVITCEMCGEFGTPVTKAGRTKVLCKIDNH